MPKKVNTSLNLEVNLGSLTNGLALSSEKRVYKAGILPDFLLGLIHLLLHYFFDKLARHTNLTSSLHLQAAHSYSTTSSWNLLLDKYQES